MLERIEGNEPGIKRWEALIKYREAKKSESAGDDDKIPKNKSSEGNRHPDTTVSRQGEAKETEQAAETRKKLGMEGCETCRNRRYVDQSDDGSVSFQVPTHIPAESAGGAVLAHEGEHVSHEQSKAKQRGEEVVDQRVQIFTAICPECGKLYVSGGLTTTTTASKKESGNSDESQSRFDVRI